MKNFQHVFQQSGQITVRIKKKDAIGKIRKYRVGEKRDMREGCKESKREEEFKGKKREERQYSKNRASRKIRLYLYYDKRKDLQRNIA